jgi:hypothetical protein
VPTFSQAFGLGKSQHELDFVDVSLLFEREGLEVVPRSTTASPSPDVSAGSIPVLVYHLVPFSSDRRGNRHFRIAPHQLMANSEMPLSLYYNHFYVIHLQPTVPHFQRFSCISDCPLSGQSDR